MNLKAKALRKGDVIGIVAPASAPRSEERITKSVEYFERLGYRVELSKHLRDSMARADYLSASDKDRVADLHAMFRSKHVRAIFYHRGGFGSIRLLDLIDYDLVKSNPKIIVGYSDATSLFAALYKKSGLTSCFFGPMPGVDLWDTVDPFSEESLWRAITSSEPIGDLPISETEGEILIGASSKTVYEGKIIGGNLTVFASLMGTPFQPMVPDSFLVLEEIDEKPRKIDAYFAQLKLAGTLNTVSAILLGQFSNCRTDPDAPTRSLDEIFDEYFRPLRVPVLQNLPFGHEKRMWTLPYGSPMELRMKLGRPVLTVTQPVLA